MPYNVYSHTKMPVITLDNALHVLAVCKQYRLTSKPQRWTRFSGSARLSWQAYKKYDIVLFPVDVRYGWEFDDESHLAILQDMYSYALPSYTWLAMLCRCWCQAGTSRKHTLAAQGRARHTNILHCMVWIINGAWINRIHVILDNPQTSHIWKKSPQPKVTPRFYEVTCPHCADQTEELGHIMCKPTTLMSTLPLSPMEATCGCGREHEMRVGSKVTATTVFPIVMCATLLDALLEHQAQEHHRVKPVTRGPVLFNSERCLVCDAYFQHRGSMGDTSNEHTEKLRDILEKRKETDHAVIVRTTLELLTE